MSTTAAIAARPDVDLADGAFYAADSRAAYRWMRAHEPVFRASTRRADVAARTDYSCVVGPMCEVDASRRRELMITEEGMR